MNTVYQISDIDYFFGEYKKNNTAATMAGFYTFLTDHRNDVQVSGLLADAQRSYYSVGNVTVVTISKS